MGADLVLMEASLTLHPSTCKCGGCFDSLQACCGAVATSLREDTRVTSRGRVGVVLALVSAHLRQFSQTFAKVVPFFFVLDMLVLFMPSNR